MIKRVLAAVLILGLPIYSMAGNVNDNCTGPIDSTSGWSDTKECYNGQSATAENFCGLEDHDSNFLSEVEGICSGGHRAYDCYDQSGINHGTFKDSAQWPGHHTVTCQSDSLSTQAPQNKR